SYQAIFQCFEKSLMAIIRFYVMQRVLMSGATLFTGSRATSHYVFHSLNRQEKTWKLTAGKVGQRSFKLSAKSHRRKSLTFPRLCSNHRSVINQSHKMVGKALGLGPSKNSFTVVDIF